MEILEITLNITAIETVIAGIMLTIALFGAPYLVRAQNKKYLDTKADKVDLIVIKSDVAKKVDKDDYEVRCAEIVSDIDKKADKDLVEKMSNQIQFLYENEINKKGKK